MCGKDETASLRLGPRRPAPAILTSFNPTLTESLYKWILKWFSTKGWVEVEGNRISKINLNYYCNSNNHI